MKKIGKLLVGLACLSVLGLCGCSDGGSSNNAALLLLTNNNKTIIPAVSIPTYSADQIIKNKVVFINGNTNEEYFEYLKFTDSTSGSYSLYKDGAKQTKYNSVDVPTTFTYEPATGKFTAGTTSSYLFNGRKNGQVVPVIASELLTTTDANPSFDSTWKISDNSTYKFNIKDLNATITKSNHSFETALTKDDGWMAAANEKFYYADFTHFYYMAFETTRESVKEEGRSISDADIVYSSTSLLLVK